MNSIKNWIHELYQIIQNSELILEIQFDEKISWNFRIQLNAVEHWLKWHSVEKREIHCHVIFFPSNQFIAKFFDLTEF